MACLPMTLIAASAGAAGRDGIHRTRGGCYGLQATGLSAGPDRHGMTTGQLGFSPTWISVPGLFVAVLSGNT
jgi:hypothetical protein